MLLSLPLETFYVFYASCSNFSHANGKPLRFYGARAMFAPLYPIAHPQWLRKGER